MNSMGSNIKSFISSILGLNFVSFLKQIFDIHDTADTPNLHWHGMFMLIIIIIIIMIY
jgi:hypothetical protein